MHLNRLYYMCHWMCHWIKWCVTGSVALVFCLIDIQWFHTRCPNKCVILYCHQNMLTKCLLCLFCAFVLFCFVRYRGHMLAINYAILIHLYIMRKMKSVNNISSKFIMLTYNNQTSGIAYHSLSFHISISSNIDLSWTTHGR